MNQERLETMGGNLLPAVAYGDALGLPVEKKTAEQIVERYGRITHLVDITENPFLGEYPAGTTSDDTQLSREIAESLIACGEFDMDDIARRHVQASHETNLGWGGSTRKAIARLEKGVSWRQSGEPDGAGNGVLMKMAPLVYWHYARPGDDVDSEEQIEQLTRMTHDSDVAVVSSLVHQDVLFGLADTAYTPESIPEVAHQVARTYEMDFPGAGSVNSRLLGQLAALGSIAPSGIIEITPKGGFYAPETLVMAYGAFAMTPEFPESVIEAVNLGGDADSIASIVGAMSVMHNPDVVWPDDVQKIYQLERLNDVSMELVRSW